MVAHANFHPQRLRFGNAGSGTNALSTVKIQLAPRRAASSANADDNHSRHNDVE